MSRLTTCKLGLMSGAGTQALATPGEAGTELWHAHDAALMLPEALVDLHYEALPSSGRGAQPATTPGTDHVTGPFTQHMAGMLAFLIPCAAAICYG